MIKIKRRTIFLSVLLFLLIFIFGVVFTNQYYLSNEVSRIHSANAIDTIDRRVSLVALELNSFPRSRGGDVLFLSRLNSLSNLINSRNDNFNLLRAVEDDFFYFLKDNPAYYQLRYIEENGSEVVRVNSIDGKIKVVDVEGLQDKSLRYYFDVTSKLSKGEVYISPLDLNIENEKLEERGEGNEIEYIPVLRYSTPLYNKNNEFKGIAITNIYANYFLDDVKNYPRNGDVAFLVDSEGNYLSHPNKTKEFGIMLNTSESFFRDYPEVANNILEGTNSRFLESEDLVFNYRHIYPKAGSFEIHSGSEKVLGNNSEENYFWVLVGVTHREEVYRESSIMGRNFIWIMGIVFIILLLIFILSLGYAHEK